jgi:prolyl-tRNA editing enzyme YbaK/EbsC (Cys-tRNA(Pro) deacylase)
MEAKMIPEKVRKILKENNLTVHEFEPGSTPTSELAAQKIGVQVGQVAKSIVFVGKDEKNYLVVCPGDRRVSSPKFKECTGTKGTLASAEETKTATGFLPGGVCPFGVDNAEILIDKELSQYEVVYPAAGTDSTLVEISFEKLVSITGGKVCDLSGEKKG